MEQCSVGRGVQFSSKCRASITKTLQLSKIFSRSIVSRAVLRRANHFGSGSKDYAIIACDYINRQERTAKTPLTNPVYALLHASDFGLLTPLPTITQLKEVKCTFQLDVMDSHSQPLFWDS